MNYDVIIPAAGRGTRMKADRNKLLLPLKGVPLIVYTIKVFSSDPACRMIILPAAAGDMESLEEIINDHSFEKPIQLIAGGKERQDSVYNGLMALKETEGMVLVHDGARPFIQQNQVEALVRTASSSGAAILAVPVKDTIKKALNNTVIETVERSSLWAVQTPQAFRISLLKEAHAEAKKTHFLGTDEASLIENLGHSVSVVEGNYDNIKITTPEDLYFAEAILNKVNDSNRP
ncbi:2-C-methyl-D-erythritol 4-phosphate cytidylyltransferase [Peribacillus sp. SCS-37]|uniref:2-C-methyl-D-erythritol 4-phosphate cytidylyltransferase n=1 Tax=Paraperibacillus esterisolvens TaxID=3115296 RepID=UPI00390649E6